MPCREKNQDLFFPTARPFHRGTRRVPFLNEVTHGVPGLAGGGTGAGVSRFCGKGSRPASPNFRTLPSPCDPASFFPFFPFPLHHILFVLPHARVLHENDVLGGRGGGVPRLPERRVLDPRATQNAHGRARSEDVIVDATLCSSIIPPRPRE